MIWFFTRSIAGWKLDKDNLKTGDINNVLKWGKIHNNPEMESGSYRYRVETNKIMVVFVFVNNTSIKCITCWRKQ